MSVDLQKIIAELRAENEQLRIANTKIAFETSAAAEKAWSLSQQLQRLQQYYQDQKISAR